MKVLVTAASKHGATEEMAAVIGQTIAAQGFDVSVLPADEVVSVEAFGAVVLGSATYAGRWMESARRLAEREQAALRERPVWLFSSGPIGDPPLPAEDAADVATITEAVGAVGARRFGGRLDRGALGMVERAVVKVMRVPERDDRNWEEVRDWANEIAQSLDPGRQASVPEPFVPQAVIAAGHSKEEQS